MLFCAGTGAYPSEEQAGFRKERLKVRGRTTHPVDWCSGATATRIFAACTDWRRTEGNGAIS